MPGISEPHVTTRLNEKRVRHEEEWEASDLRQWGNRRKRVQIKRQCVEKIDSSRMGKSCVATDSFLEVAPFAQQVLRKVVRI